MKQFLFTMVAIMVFISCAQTQSKDFSIPVGSKAKKTANEAVATFGEGCFWHTEIVFQSLVGVRDAVSGYAGGTVKNPDYEKVTTGTTGHAEVVNVYYDPSIISYQTLVQAFFSSQDPTTLNRQGNDVGTQYRSVALYRNDKEKEILQMEMKKLTDAKKYQDKIVTQIVPFDNFYVAEDYHQEYISRHPENPYVRNVSIPDYMKFRSEFKGNFKGKG